MSEHATVAPWPVDQPIPKMCKVADVCRIFQWSQRRFYEYLRDQKIPFREVTPRIGTPRFKGEDVQRFIEGGYTAHGKLRSVSGGRR